MIPAHVHDARLAEALIQGDEQGYFADNAYSDQTSARRSKGVGWSTAWRGAVGRTIRSNPGASPRPRPLPIRPSP